MTNPSIYAGTTTTTAVTANATLPLITILRRPCNNVLGLAGNNITLNDRGTQYYKVEIDATFTAPAAGVVILNLQQNGVNVAGATASTTITTADTEVRSLTITALVKTVGCCNIDTLSVINSGVAISLSNYTVTITKQ